MKTRDTQAGKKVTVVVLKNCGWLLAMICMLALLAMPAPLLAEESTLEYPELKSQEKQHSELEGFARRMFEEATDLYKSEMFKESGVKFKELIYLYPGFSQVQEATFLMGESYYKVGMWTDARDAYRRIVTDYRQTSPHVGESYYKLEQIEFKLARYMQALAWYRKIESEFNESKFIDGARYTGGNCHYELGEFEDAEQLFGKVNNSSEFYGFALYSTALCHVQSDRFEDAISTLHLILNINDNSILTDSLKGRVHVTMGRLFYEVSNDPQKMSEDPKWREQNLDQAMREFDSVGGGDKENYDKALLGKGWVYIRHANDAATAVTRARNEDDKKKFENTKKDYYHKANSMMERITSMGANSELTAEAWLTRAHCMLGLEQYDDATRIYNMVIQRFSAESEMKQADPQVAAIYNDIMDEYEAIDKTGQMATKLREISIDQGRNDLLPRVDREMSQIDRLRQDLSKLEMWFFDRSTSGASINYGSKFGLSIIKFEKEEKTSAKIEEIASAYTSKTDTLVAEQEKLRKKLGKLSLEQGQSNLGMELKPGQAAEEGVILFRNGKRDYIKTPGDLDNPATPGATGTTGTEGKTPELKEQPKDSTGGVKPEEKKAEQPSETKPTPTPDVETKPEEGSTTGEIKPSESGTTTGDGSSETPSGGSEGETGGSASPAPEGTIATPDGSTTGGTGTTPAPEETTPAPDATAPTESGTTTGDGTTVPEEPTPPGNN